MENAEHAHLGRPGVLQAVRQAGRQVQAGPRRERMLGATDVRRPGAAEYQPDLVVRVAMFRRAPRRDLTHELRSDRAAAARAEQDAELPVAGGLDLAVGEVLALQRTAGLFTGGGRYAARSQRDHAQAL